MTSHSDTPPVLPERTYWTTNAHGHMEISGVYVEALESAYAKAVEALNAVRDNVAGSRELMRSYVIHLCEEALRSLPKVPK